MAFRYFRGVLNRKEAIEGVNVKKKAYLPLAAGMSFLAVTVAGCAVGAGANGPATGPDGKENVGQSAAALSPSDPVTMVAVSFYTGGDDKRGGTEVDWELTIRGINSTYQTDSSDWGNYTWTPYYYARVPQGITNGDISNLGVNLVEHDGFIQMPDNWNMNEISVWTPNPNGSWNNIANPGGNPLKRFYG